MKFHLREFHIYFWPFAGIKTPLTSTWRMGSQDKVSVVNWPMVSTVSHVSPLSGLGCVVPLPYMAFNSMAEINGAYARSPLNQVLGAHPPSG